MDKRFSVLFSIIIFLSSCNATKQERLEEHKTNAEQLFESVYGGDISNIENLVTDDIVSSYPIFEEVFNKKAIRGKEAYTNFAMHFGERWKETKVTIHEAIAENNRVVLMWSFTATQVNPDDPADSTSGHKRSWGGITLFYFDESGKISAEIGEESTPGPFSRLETTEK